jgi:hypothetical protein
MRKVSCILALLWLLALMAALLALMAALLALMAALLALRPRRPWP